MSYAPRILIVDSELEFRLFAEQTLSCIGYSVTTADSKQRALAEIRTRAFNAIILSLDLPGENRIELMSQICAYAPHVPVLATYTGTAGGAGEKDIAAGASMLLKPVSPEAFLLEVYRLLDPRQTWVGVDVANPFIARVLLALKVLTSSCYPNETNAVTHQELDELLSYFGDDARELSSDQIACLVIQREIKRQEGV